MIRAIAIDDEPLGLKIIAHFCDEIDFISLEKTFTKQNEALKYLKNYPVDLIFWTFKCRIKTVLISIKCWIMTPL